MSWKMTLLSGMMVYCSFSTLTFATEQNTLRIGVNSGYAPFEVKTNDGKLSGLDIDIGNEVCKRLNVRCQWIELNFDSLIPALQAKKIDVINSAMNITEKRKQAIAFTAPIYVVPIQMVAKKDSALQPNAASLKGKRLGVQQGTSQEDYAKKYWATAGVNIISYPEQNEVFMALAAGRLDAALQETQTAQDDFLKQPQGADFTFVGQPLKDDETLGKGTGFGLRKSDTTLTKQVDQTLTGMKVDGTLRQLSMKYFQQDITAQ